MEQLAKESLTNIKEENPEDEPTKENLLFRRESTIENLQESKEAELKKSIVSKYSNFEIFMKSIRVSLKNWKYCLFTRTTEFLFYFINMHIQFQKGIIIDCITNESQHHLLYPNFIYIVKILIFDFIIKNIFEFIKRHFIDNSHYEFKNTLIEEVTKKDIEFFDLYKTGELLEKMENCDIILEINILEHILKDLQSLFQIIFLIYFLLKNYFEISIISISIVIMKKISVYLSEKVAGSFDIHKWMQLDEKCSTYLTDFVLNIRLIKSFATEELELNRIKRARRKYYNFSESPLSILKDIVSSLSSIGDYYLLYIIGTFVISGKLTFGHYTIFDNYFNKFECEFELFYATIKRYNNYLIKWRNFFEIYDYPKKITSLKNYIPKEKIKGKIDFKNVKFSYPLSPDVLILDDLSFTIEQGKILALVGFSGSGKSTISNLIQRFYDPIDGNVFIDDINIKDFNVDWLHRNIGFVSQEPTLFNGTVEDNITYGVKEYTKSKLEEVCENPMNKMNAKRN